MRLIDADKLRDWVRAEANPYGAPTLDYNSGLKVLDMIERMPTVEPENDWIPCKERLPEDLQEVNVTWVNHNPEPYYNSIKDKPFTATAVYYKEKWYWYSSTCADMLAEYGRNPNQEIDGDIEITAWAPLPKAYKPKEETA